MADPRDPAATASALDARVAALIEAGVEVLDPRQCYIGPGVELARIRPGARLYPGVRIEGARSFVGPGARVGSEGPATLRDAVLAASSEVAGGFVEGAVLLEGAKLGSAAHVRAGSLLEEQASVAHAVGLKHSILLAFVTVGSNVNFCDVLMAGGSSRADHSEVGSGFIHFNFTPWGERGDKATPSLIGDVPRGVYYRERRIFLGGSSGMIGPRKVGYGSVAAAGQVIRHDIPDDRMVLRPPPRLDRPLKDRIDGSGRARRNRAYIAQLVALRSFYRVVRVGRARDADARAVLEAAIALLDGAIVEREQRLFAYLRERGRELPKIARAADPKLEAACPLPLAREADSHLDFIASLDADEHAAGVAWLESIVEATLA